jgi:hypothetical protein
MFPQNAGQQNNLLIYTEDQHHDRDSEAQSSHLQQFANQGYFQQQHQFNQNQAHGSRENSYSNIRSKY